MGKRKSTRRAGKSTTGLRKPVRRHTAVHKPGTGEQRRLAPQAPAKKAARRSLDTGIGAKYAVLVSVAVILVSAGAGFVVTGTVRGVVEDNVISGAVANARAVALAARPALEQDTASLLDLEYLWQGGAKSSKELLIVEVYDTLVGGTPVARHAKVSRALKGKRPIVKRRYTVSSATIKNRRVIVVEMPVASSNLTPLGRVVVIHDASRAEKLASGAWLPVVMIGGAVLAVGVFLTFMIAGRTGEEMGKVDVKVRRMTMQLRSAKEKEKEAEQIGHDLDAAREIQAQLLPEKIPQIPGYDVYPYYLSAKEVGGDYYDFFPIDSGRLAMVVADVSGKGIPGSMVMATTRTVLRILGPQCIEAPAIMRQTNIWVAKDIKRGMFVTAMFAILNVRKREMSVCSAGHNPMVLFRERTGRYELVNPSGIALGFDKGPIFDRTLQERKITLEGGDRVVMYTDGVVEAMNLEHEEYGDERLYEFVRKNARMRSKEFVNALVSDLEEHKGSADQHDDITISTFRVFG